MPEDSTQQTEIEFRGEPIPTTIRAKKHTVLFPNIRERADDLVLLWVGAVQRAEGAHVSRADLLMQYVFAPLLGHAGSKFPTYADLGPPESILGSVAELPRVRIGGVYRYGRRTRTFAAETLYFPNIILPRRPDQRTRLAANDEGDYLIDFTRFADLYRYAGTYMVDIPGVLDSAGRAHRLIFPWFTVARFFFAGSSALINALFMSYLVPGGAGGRRIYDPDPAKTDWCAEPENHFHVRLEKWVTDKDCRVVAHLAAYDHFREAALQLSHSLACGINHRATYPHCYFPVPAMQDVTVRGVPVYSKSGAESFLVLEIITANVAESLSPPIRGVIFSRDNDGRPSPDKRYAMPRPTVSLPKPELPSPETPLTPIPGAPRNTRVSSVPIEEHGYFSSFADDKRIPVLKPAKEWQETQNENWGVVNSPVQSDTFTVSPDGQPLHGNEVGAIYTGDAEYQLSRLPQLDSIRDDRLRLLCEATHKLAGLKKYIIEWLPIGSHELTHYYFPAPRADAPDRGKIEKWLTVVSGLRRYWVCRVFNHETRHFFYLIEMQRRHSRESFYGVILFHENPTSTLTEEAIDAAMTAVAERHGKWSKVTLPPPLTKQAYRHEKKKRNQDRDVTVNDLVEKLERTFRRKRFSSATDDSAPSAA
jgi:hypothetical protein